LKFLDENEIPETQEEQSVEEIKRLKILFEEQYQQLLKL